MKKVLAGLAMVGILAVPVVSLHAQQQNVAGEWTMLVQGMSLRLVMTQAGERISGSMDSPHGVIALKGEFSKGTLTLVGASTDTHPVQFTLTSTLGPNGSLSGSVSVNSMEIPFTAQKNSSKEVKAILMELHRHVHVVWNEIHGVKEFDRADVR